MMMMMRQRLLLPVSFLLLQLLHLLRIPSSIVSFPTVPIVVRKHHTYHHTDHHTYHHHPPGRQQRQNSVNTIQQSFIVSSLLFMAKDDTKNNNSNKSKGFGKPTVVPTPSSSSSSSSTSSSTTSAASTISTTPTAQDVTSVPTTTTTTTTTMNAGQRALQELRRQRIEEKDLELRQVRELLQIDEQIQRRGRNNIDNTIMDDDNDTTTSIMAIPEIVAQRMGLRMLPFVGIPFFGGMIAFIVFWYMATYQNIQYEPSLVAATTIGLLIFGLLGITYSVMSASWDPDREGSFLGYDEFQINIQNVQDGLRRSRTNAILRDKIASTSSQDIQRALLDLQQREYEQQQQKRNK